jgi:hypothetical protein
LFCFLRELELAVEVEGALVTSGWGAAAAAVTALTVAVEGRVVAVLAVVSPLVLSGVSLPRHRLGNG